jgi:hypothetical protein
LYERSTASEIPSRFRNAAMAVMFSSVSVISGMSGIRARRTLASFLEISNSRVKISNC